MSSWANGSTLRGMERRAHSGFASGAVPFGYTTAKVAHAGGEASRIEIDPVASEVVRRIFRSYADGHSQATIAAMLNASSAPAPRPRRERRREGWRPTSIRNILRNAKYRGVWSFGTMKWIRDPDTGRRRPQRRDAALLELERPELAIVDAELWSAVRARLDSVERTYAPSGVTTPRATRRAYALSGVLACATCGALLTVTGGEEGRRYYRCTGAQRGKCDAKRSHRVDELERAVSSISSVTSAALLLAASEARESLRASVGRLMVHSDGSITSSSMSVATPSAPQRPPLSSRPSVPQHYECFHCRCTFDERDVPSEFDHFPVPASRGGTKTVRSCVECHALIDRSGIEALPRGVTSDARKLAERAVGSAFVGTAEEFDDATDGLPTLARIIAAAIVKRSWFAR